MKYYDTGPKIAIEGRVFEKRRLQELADSGQPAIIIVHGRRRVGKTTLIEQSLGKRNILKFEGIEKQNSEYQRGSFLKQLAFYAENSFIEKVAHTSWREVLMALVEVLKIIPFDQPITLFFEELQWMACYEDQLVAELKFVWDNYLAKRQNLLLVVCGSSPSFMVANVVKSKALHNRSMHEIPLRPFTIPETYQFLKSSEFTHEQVLDTYLAVGGIPEYLNYVKRDKGGSPYAAICKNSFVPGAFFLGEYDRIFVSSLSENRYYRHIVQALAAKPFQTRKQLLSALELSSNGLFSQVLEDLCQATFVYRYEPLNSPEDSILQRFELADPYLRLYHQQIRPLRGRIEQGEFIDRVMSAFSLDSWRQWLGYNFEHLWRVQSRLLALHLGFSDLDYQVGAYFNRGSLHGEGGAQFDLVFDRPDKVLTVCEMKYTSEPPDLEVAKDFMKKIAVFKESRVRRYARYRIQKVLVTLTPPTEALVSSAAFDRIVTAQSLIQG